MNNAYIENMEGMAYRRDAMNGLQRSIKRLLDFVFALIGLVALSPLF